MSSLAEHYSTTLTELLFEKTNEFVGVYDLTAGRFTRVNQAGVRMLGFPSEAALLNDPVRSRSVRYPPLNDESLGSLIARVMAIGTYEEQTVVGRQDGQTFWGQLTITAFSVPDSPYALIRLVDQGKLHQAERDLEHSVRRNEAIFSSATIGIVVCDRVGQIVSANRLAHHLFGYADNGLISQTIEQLVPAGLSHYHTKLRHSFNENPQVRAMGQNRDLQAQRADGSVFPIEISLSYFQLDEELFVVAYIIDITLKKEAERQLLAHKDHIEQLNADLEQKVVDRTHALMNTLEQLEQSKDELARALTAEQELGELKSRFVSMASHEFRTPLTAVLTSATLIAKYTGGDQQDKRQKHIDRIRSSVKNLNDILEEFLSLGKLEAGKLTAQPVQVQLNQVVAETVADMRLMLKPGQTIETRLNGPDTAWLDPSMLQKTLINLLSNATKYSGPGSLVTVVITYSEKQFTISVADQGVGISSDDQRHLFERFFRAHNATNIPGTGLGLHIVGRYVELMGGTVALISELNQGTTVTITLPYENHTVD